MKVALKKRDRRVYDRQGKMMQINLFLIINLQKRMRNQEPNDKEKSDQRKRLVNSYLQYSTLGFQMVAIIGVFAFIGYSIDERKNSVTPLYTAFFSLAGVFIALYLVIRSLKKIKP